jgi:hypothetical protein
MKYELLDRMSFHELAECLEYVLEKIKTIEAEVGKNADDPRLDRLYLTANKIIVRLNALVQQGNVRPSAENLTVWNELMPKYERGYERYLDTLQDEDILFDSE